ncbi:hypothetical protein KY290_013755 [Solanum tuberosum]|uniref:Aminotransferase-like plant mobile domain-containing protein n=1 Tax=Solanum tuberosum TaxID=4113 RepID=A0ABQ7VMQ1_SOLTU|nr:hypothetical protein KY290_013754 [Solanum tuberosum]KAH0769774.1 hypothetical protein KY290_013755 [Solanum tuberosum]
MQINQNLPDIRMMTAVPRTLKEWWGNIRVAYGNEIMLHSGSLTDLLNVEANKSLITLMIEFWQPTTVTFQFTDFEITPTLEEISQIANLPLVGRVSLAPRTTSGINFLQSLGLRVGKCLRRVDEGWVKLDYLFKRFGRRDSYDKFHQEFFISRVDWEKLRAIVFMTAFLGIMIFPNKKGCVDINLLPMIIFMFRGPIRVTIVPMILAEIFRSLSLCSRGYDHFKGSNLLLQIWVLEHFYQRHAENGIEADLRNKIRSHATRLSMWDAPNDEDGWRLFLTHVTGNRIQWRLPWVHGRALLRTNQDYFIELIGLEGFQPYAPLRVLRQFGITQGVPLWSNMALIEVNYEGRIPIERIATLVQEWCGILDSDMGVESWCTPEYYAWFMIGGILARPSYEGILGFTDTQRSKRISMELLNLMHITTTMYQQVTPRSIDHLIQAVDDEPNEEMEEDPEEDPREPTEEMEEDPEEYSEYDSNLYDPRDGGVMHIEDEHVPTIEDAHSEYGSIGFDEREDSNNWEWKIDESPEYHPGPYYDVDDNDDEAPTWP